MATPKGAVPNSFHTYNRWDVISAFHKELRRGDVEQATYWLEVMLSGGGTDSNGKSRVRFYVMDYLFRACGEELAPSHPSAIACFDYIAKCMSYPDGIRVYHLYYAVSKFCAAKKWWFDEEGKDLRKLWAKHAKALHENKFREIPDYAHDKHTSRGAMLLQSNPQKMDRRWEGTWAGMVWRSKAAELAENDGVDSLDGYTWDEIWNVVPKELEFWEWMEKDVC